MPRQRGSSSGPARSPYRSLTPTLPGPFGYGLSLGYLDPGTDIDFQIVDSIHDGRIFHPDRPSPGRVIANELFYPSRHLFRFARPSRVVLCARRKTRRSVLFALRRTGKGRRAQRRRYTEYSRVRC